MKISQLAIFNISELMTYKKGSELVRFFNEFGSMDIYDESGLPDIGKRNGQRPSKRQYVEKRLTDLNDTNEFRNLIIKLAKETPEVLTKLDQIIRPDGYSIENVNGKPVVLGGVIKKNVQIINEAHFQDIQNRILHALDGAKVSIVILMAWFTNEKLFQKLLEKHRQGVDVRVAILDDGINRKHGVDLTQLPEVIYLKRGTRGGLMHNKYCIIDNQIVITGSYNWSDNAEFKNDENVVIEHDNQQASNFSVDFRKITSKK